MATHVKTLAVMRIQLVAMLFLTAAGIISYMVPLYLLLYKKPLPENLYESPHFN